MSWFFDRVEAVLQALRAALAAPSPWRRRALTGRENVFAVCRTLLRRASRELKGRGGIGA